MTNINCGCRAGCTALAVAASIIIGIVTAFLTITAAITVTPAFVWVTLGIAVVYLLGLVTAPQRSVHECGCPILSALITGILGTALTSVILLAITFAATSVIGAIITGALLFFLSLILTSAACYVKCKAGCLDD